MVRLIIMLSLMLAATSAAAKAQPFADVAQGIIDAVKAKKPLAGFVHEKGFELVYRGSDRADGSKTAKPVKAKPKQIDEAVEVTVKADGKGWMTEDGKQKPKPRTYKHKVRIADYEYESTSIDEKKKAILLWNTSISVDIVLEQGRTWKIRKVTLSEDDPG